MVDANPAGFGLASGQGLLFSFFLSSLLEFCCVWYVLEA